MSKRGHILIALICLAVIGINLLIYKIIIESDLPFWLKIFLID